MVSEDRKEFMLKVVYFTSLAGASILLGFSSTLGRFKKGSPLEGEAALHEEAVILARKALMRGTIYSVCGFGLFTTATYYLFGRKMIANFKEQHKTKENDKDLIELENLFK